MCRMPCSGAGRGPGEPEFAPAASVPARPLLSPSNQAPDQRLPLCRPHFHSKICAVVTSPEISHRLISLRPCCRTGGVRIRIAYG